MARGNQAHQLPMTSEQLTGSEDWLGVRTQMQHAVEAIVQVRLRCLCAWEASNRSARLLNLIQSQGEPYVDFVSGLKDAIQKTVSQPELQDLLMQTLSFENANVECQKIHGL